ncbi:hypothetical protein AX16_009317 [Volvariella volvacea WC 439]|nr:hypothetical protein AX16_009317 [Volvariella volvacea WC 439]
MPAQVNGYRSPSPSDSDGVMVDPSPNRPSKSSLPPPPISTQPRTIVCCFDGTGNKFGENSNVVRFCTALRKDDPERQLVYYQPGIGTYNPRQFFTRTFSHLASVIDQGVALHLNDHVKDGYKFIMQHYRKGDKICLFGFSRGAYTARVVAGMLYKVGILPAHNDQLIDFAFTIYQTTGERGYLLSKEFKATFAMSVTVEFVGVWDTVSSVGIIPRQQPYTSVNYAVKTFRHALALDECRARFRPNTWNEPTLGKEQELDVDEPDLPSIVTSDSNSADDWYYEPPRRNIADVQEVWFAGCHADIGGGSHKNKIKDSLSFIPLRWMIKECLLNRTGILFKYDKVVDLGFDLHKLADEVEGQGIDLAELGLDRKAIDDVYRTRHNLSLRNDRHKSPLSAITPTTTHANALARANSGRSRYTLNLRHPRDAIDILAEVWDQLVINPWWKILEIIPMLGAYQDELGHWWYIRRPNCGRGRYIPFDRDTIRVHDSVRDKAEKEGYVPKAYNWDVVKKSGMLEWVS